MIIYKRILGFLSAFLIAGSLLLASYFQSLAWYLIGFSLLVLIFYFWKVKNRFITYKKLSAYFLVLLVFLASFWMVFITIDNIFLKYIVFFFILFVLVSIFDSIFKYVYENIEIKNQVFIYLDLCSFWFISYFLFYSQVILRVNLILLSFVLLIFVAALTMQRFYWNNINTKKELSFVLIISIIMIELYLATVFLSFSFYLSTLVLWMWYYLLLDFSVDKIKDVFYWHKKSKMIIVAVFVFVLSILSIR